MSPALKLNRQRAAGIRGKKVFIKSSSAFVPIIDRNLFFGAKKKRKKTKSCPEFNFEQKLFCRCFAQIESKVGISCGFEEFLDMYFRSQPKVLSGVNAACLSMLEVTLKIKRFISSFF